MSLLTFGEAFFTVTVQVSQQFFAVNKANKIYTCKNRLSAYRMFSRYIKKQIEQTRGIEYEV